MEELQGIFHSSGTLAHSLRPIIYPSRKITNMKVYIHQDGFQWQVSSLPTKLSLECACLHMEATNETKGVTDTFSMKTTTRISWQSQCRRPRWKRCKRENISEVKITKSTIKNLSMPILPSTHSLTPTNLYAKAKERRNSRTRLYPSGKWPNRPETDW